MTVRVETLPGGLRVISHAMAAVETVSLGVWVRVGARYETAENNGVSHLLEHMAFKGTERRTARDIAEEIEAVGGQLNAYTSREFTAYHATVLKEDVAIAVDIIADILRNAAFDEHELARERAVVLQEIGQVQDTPDDLVFDLFQETAFPDQPIGRCILGPASVVGTMGRESLRGYMDAHYTAPAMVFAAAGNLDHDALTALVAAGFSGLGGDGGTPPVPAHYAGGERRIGRTLEQVHLILGFNGISYGDADYYAAAVTSMLLGGGMSSRLFQEVRENRGLAYSVYTFSPSYADAGLFGVYAGTGAEEVTELVPVLCDELVRAAQGVDEAELIRARAQLRAGMLMSLESTTSRAEQLARQLHIYGRPLPIAEINERIEAVDGAAVRRVMERLLMSRPTLAALGPVEKLEAFEEVAGRLGGGPIPSNREMR